jgi:tetratricopeptide (TPR) repeat protein
MKKISEKEPNAQFVHFLLASEYFRARLFLLAAEHFEKAVELRPEADAGARFNLARSLFHAGRSDQSEQAVRELLTIDPRHFSARHLLATLLAKKGEYGQAVEEELKVLEIRSYYLPALNNLGSFYLKTGNNSLAIRTFLRGLEVDPNLLLLRRNLTLAYLISEDCDEAFKQAEILTRMDPENAVGFYYMGRAYSSKGMPDQARRSFLKARELEPTIAVPNP